MPLPTKRRPRSIPTEKQAEKLRILASGAIVLAPGRGDWKPLVRRGWVAPIGPDDGSRYFPPLAITADGLKAYAAAAAFDGIPDPDWGKREKPRQLDEHPTITKLKQERDEAREQARVQERARHFLDARLRRIKYAMEGWEA